MSWRQSLWMGAGILAALAALYFIQTPFRDITSPPPKQVRESPPLEAELSYLSIPITLPLDVIQAFANQEIPETLVKKKEDRKFKVRFLGIPTTVEGEVETVVRRRGPVKVRSRDGWLELSVPLRFRAHLDGEDIFDPDAKTRGAVTITARFRIGVDESWQPQLDAQAGYHWDRKPYLRMGLIRVRVSSLIGRELEDRLDKAVQKLKDRVHNELDLKTKAAARWHELHQVRSLSESLGAWLIIDPHAAYFPPVQYGEDALKLEFGLASYLQTAVGNVPAPPVSEPLPPLHLGPAPKDGFSIQLPIRLDYAGIGKRLNAEHAGKTIDLNPGTLTPKEFKIYASENALVVAARISAKSPKRVFNTHGWIYLVGEPRYDAEKRMLYVENLNFSRQLDNFLVTGATWVLQDSLRDRISRSLQFDLHDRIEELRTSANERINRPLGEGFMLSGELENLNLAYLIPQQKALLLVMNAQGHLAISSSMQDIGLSD